ncbi:hypothetical protein DOY81_004887 [Sarcophaga bullata]|nr:hypothetical protein DOY81_004887 [Sarcophaga bullata]
MENIEEKLQNYRLRKRRQERIQQFKETIKGFLMLGVNDTRKPEMSDNTSATIHDTESNETFLEQKHSDSNIPIGSDSGGTLSSSDEETNQQTIPDEVNEENRVYQYALQVVYIAFWVTLYIIAIELQFGIVFLMFSALVAIYLNTRTGPKKRNEISAYSVFNKNCESIDGTLKAEQFEREIGIR